MKSTTIKAIVFNLILVLLFTNCKKDKDLVPVPQPILNSPELTTSMVLKLTDSSNTSNIILCEFRDPDGPGGNTATKFDTIKLLSNKTYILKLILLDETKNPIDTVSNEIWDERNDHQFFFTHSGVSINSTYLDNDENGYPVGLTTKWRTSATSAGTSKIVLKHQAGTKNGSESLGETDIEVIFQSKVQ